MNKTVTTFLPLPTAVSPQLPDFGGAILPVRARLLRVTQKVSSNSIHTLLLADANKIGEPTLSDH